MIMHAKQPNRRRQLAMKQESCQGTAPTYKQEGFAAIPPPPGQHRILGRAVHHAREGQTIIVQNLLGQKVYIAARPIVRGRMVTEGDIINKPIKQQESWIIGRALTDAKKGSPVKIASFLGPVLSITARDIRRGDILLAEDLWQPGSEES